jgi:hypothetical protein
MSKAHNLSVSLAGAHEPDTNLFLEKEPAFDHQALFDNGNDNRVILLPDMRHRLDLPADLRPTYLDALLPKRLGDHLGLLSRDPRDRNTPGFHRLFRYRDFFTKQGNDNFAVLVQLFARGAAARGAADLRRGILSVRNTVCCFGVDDVGQSTPTAHGFSDNDCI